MGEKRKIGVWELEESEKLNGIVMGMLGETEWSEEMGLDIDVVSGYFDWSGVSEKMGDRSRSQCRNKWAQLENWKKVVQNDDDEEGVQDEEGIVVQEED